MSYDPLDHSVLLFGGSTRAGTSSVNFDQTWTYQAGRWSLLNVTPHPGARWGAALVYDASDGYMFLYGGSVSSCNPYVAAGCGNDSWLFHNGSWARIPTTGVPDVTSGMVMVYDAAAGYVLLYGGTGPRDPNSAATWKYHAGVWTNITRVSGPAPPARYEAVGTYSSADREVVVFGGFVRGGYVVNETWVFSNGSWTNLTPSLSRSPMARAAETLVYNPVSKLVMLVGGQFESGTSQPGAWAFSKGHWGMLVTNGPIPPTGQMTWDGQDRYMFFHTDGGQSFSFSRGNWTQIDQASPALGWGAAVAYDPTDGYVLQFGGVYLLNGNPWGASGATWSFEGGRWSNLTSGLSSAPSARNAAAMAFDPKDQEVILFGGETWTGGSTHLRALNDTWSFAGGVWTNITRSGAPPSGGTLTWDDHDGYLLLYNPAGSPTSWSFVGGRWSNLTSSVHPPSGSSNCGYTPALAYDYSDGYVVMFGCWVNVTWTFASGVWTDVTGSVAPSPERDVSIGYDFPSHRLILWGGAIGDMWAFHNGHWIFLDPNIVDGNGAPGTSDSTYNWGSMTWDALDGYLLFLSVLGQYNWSVR